MSSLSPAEVLARVRDKQEVGAGDIRNFIHGLKSGSTADYQAAAFCMAVYLNGLHAGDTVALTLAMRDSGDVIRLDDILALKVDKHSTGGVGDKISLPLAPMVAACGVPVPMVAGRGLGHTGGTLDKLEAIAGFSVLLSTDEFRAQVKDLGCAIMGQSEGLAPADKMLYALRDVTATVASVPLITASILSKKLAEGIDALVLDVKVGRAAFMQNIEDARRLSKSLIEVGEGAGVSVRAVLTRMEEPLGRTIGNSLEVIESVEILQGRGPEDTTDLTLTLGAEMLVAGGAAKDMDEGRRKLRKTQMDGSALSVFKKMVEAQGGDPAFLDDFSLLPTAEHTTEVLCDADGFVHAIDGLALGEAAMELGAGRKKASDQIDPSVGIEVLCRVGDKMHKGEAMLRVHHNQDFSMQSMRDALSLNAEFAAAHDSLVIECHDRESIKSL